MHILFHMWTIGQSWGCKCMHSNECLKAFVILDLQEHTDCCVLRITNGIQYVQYTFCILYHQDLV